MSDRIVRGIWWDLDGANESPIFVSAANISYYMFYCLWFHPTRHEKLEGLVPREILIVSGVKGSWDTVWQCILARPLSELKQDAHVVSKFVTVRTTLCLDALTLTTSVSPPIVSVIHEELSLTRGTKGLTEPIPFWWFSDSPRKVGHDKKKNIGHPVQI